MDKIQKMVDAIYQKYGFTREMKDCLEEVYFCEDAFRTALKKAKAVTLLLEGCKAGDIGEDGVKVMHGTSMQLSRVEAFWLRSAREMANFMPGEDVYRIEHEVGISCNGSLLKEEEDLWR